MDRAPNRPWVIAHRGASAARPENTIAAFRHARVLGADAVELDVRRTGDGILVVHHDAAVAGIGPIVTVEAAALAGRVPSIPTLAEALDACAGMWVNVEVKNSPSDPDWDPSGRVVAGVATVVDEMAMRDRVLVSSFDLPTVARAVESGLAGGLLCGPALDPIPAADAAAGVGAAAVHPHAGSLRSTSAGAVIDAAATAGLLVIAWTVDDRSEMRRLAAAGVDGIITNVPDVARSALEHGDRDRS